MSTDEKFSDYVIYIVGKDGWEDMLWYTENLGNADDEGITKALAIFNKAENHNHHLRLYGIRRPGGRELLRDNEVSND